MDSIKAKRGDRVKVHYIGKFLDGNIFESSFSHKLLEFTIGDGAVLKPINDAVEGMHIGEVKAINVFPEQAYGQRINDLIIEMPKKALGNIKPEIGKTITITSKTGKKAHGIIIEIKNDTVVVDANHPLAGKTLVFDIKLEGIEK